MVETKIYTKSLSISDKWSPTLNEFGKSECKWIAEVEIELIDSQSKPIGDLCWFYICSSILSIDEIIKNEVFDIQNNYIVQSVLDLDVAKGVIDKKLTSIDNSIIKAEAFLFFD